MTIERSRAILVAIAMACLVALPGCGKSTGPAISGTVVNAGQPVSSGVISFIPASGPTATLVIRDGEFSSSGSGDTTVAGDYTVTVRVPKEGTDAAEPEQVSYEFSTTVPEEGSSSLAFDLAEGKVQEGN